MVLKNMKKLNVVMLEKYYVKARVPYTTNEEKVVSGMYYRLFVKEGKNELTVIDYEPIENTPNSNYFLIDTSSLIPNTYYIDVKVEDNLNVSTLKELGVFDITNQITD